MALWKPTRRELIASAPLALGAAALHRPVRATGNGRLRLFVVGDWGRDGGHYQKHVAALMDYHARQRGCDLIASTGDNFYYFGVASASDSQWRTSYEDIYSPHLRALPWFVVAGNHDWGGSVWAQLDRTGNAGWQMPWLWYDIPGSRFGRPDVHFFFIDTLVWRNNETPLFKLCGQSVRPEDIEAQKRWLASALRASCATTKIVVGHHPIYRPGTDGGGMTLRDLDAMLIDARVTAYICGHKHCLYHVKGEHLDYICSGGGSEERERDRRGLLDPKCARNGTCAPARLEQFVGRAGFAMFDIGADDLRYNFVDRAGRVTPSLTIRSRGNHALGCSGALPPSPGADGKYARARGKTFLPCTTFE